MLIKEKVENVEHYLSVESNYKDPLEGKGKMDGVLFEMGKLGNGIDHSIDSCVIVSADDARAFAHEILETCEEIEGKRASSVEELEKELKNHEAQLQYLAGFVKGMGK